MRDFVLHMIVEVRVVLNNRGMQEVACNVAGYEQFLETRLRTDLYDASSLKQALSDEQEDFRALEQNLHLLLKVCDTALSYSLCKCACWTPICVQGQICNFRTLISVGKEQGIQVQAEVPDTKYVFVKIGLGFHVQCTLQEALNIAADKQQQLQVKIDQQTNTISKIKARITLMQESIEAIQAS